MVLYLTLKKSFTTLVELQEYKMSNIEDTQEYKDWAAELDRLNKYINSINPWNDQAERMQARYDDLLFNQDPRLKKDNK